MFFVFCFLNKTTWEQMLIQEKSQAEGPLPSSTAVGSMSLLKILPSVHPNSLQNPSALQRDVTSPSPASLTCPTSHFTRWQGSLLETHPTVSPQPLSTLHPLFLLTLAPAILFTNLILHWLLGPIPLGSLSILCACHGGLKKYVLRSVSPG